MTPNFATRRQSNTDTERSDIMKRHWLGYHDQGSNGPLSFDLNQVLMINLQRHEGRKIMGTERAQDLQAFKSFVDQQLADDPIPTVGEVIARWDAENRPDEEQADKVHADKESLADIEAGESGIPLERL